MVLFVWPQAARTVEPMWPCLSAMKMFRTTLGHQLWRGLGVCRRQNWPGPRFIGRLYCPVMVSGKAEGSALTTVNIQAIIFTSIVMQRHHHALTSKPVWRHVVRIPFTFFLQLLLFPFLKGFVQKKVDAVARKEIPVILPKVQVAAVRAKYTCTLLMWLCMKWHCNWCMVVWCTQNVHRDGSSFKWHQPCSLTAKQHCV